ncbi:hypothetical protein HAX54_019604 [Datura stramonium]|uniref:Replication protein A 70 kDa DNA-binding subunit B/D first OB fold domain-containing protein n=1 Tax=Datura stramonium TaxID=4076 RepID=A0ABS8UPN7_DATST|nr:hypothetical protein [Datura stramonium]
MKKEKENLKEAKDELQLSIQEVDDFRLSTTEEKNKDENLLFVSQDCVLLRVEKEKEMFVAYDGLHLISEVPVGPVENAYDGLHLISEVSLVSGRDYFMIKVRLCRIWDAINPNKNGELINVEIIFINEKGNLKHDIIRQHQVQRFKEKLIEGSLFTIKNFKVVETIGGYKPVENLLTLIFIASIVKRGNREEIRKLVR